MDINEEGRRELERLKKEYLVDGDELHVWECQELLKKLYDCQEDMESLLDGGKDDKHYFLMEILIKRLEVYLQNKQDML
jgi:hypothetical protein